MEIDCTGTVFAKYFGKAFDQISFGCPTFLSKNEDRRMVRQYNKKPARYHRSVNEVVKDVKGRVSVSYSNLVHKNERRSTVAKPPESDQPQEAALPEGLLDVGLAPDSSSEDAQVVKNTLYYLGAGVGAVGLGALATVGLVTVGGVACSVFLIERLLCVDPEYQQNLKALEVPNVYRPDINNNMYEYRSPYRY